MEYNKNLKTNTTKSDTQSENWMEQDDIRKLWNDSLINITQLTKGKRKLEGSDFETLTNFLVLSLYVLIPPRRSDYLKMKILDDNEMDKEYNYLDIKNKKFIFQNYKTSGKYKVQEVDIPKNLMDIINLYMKFRKDKTGAFLIKPDGSAFETINSITRILNKIFKKKISVSMLRNIYLTDKYAKENKEKEKDASAMGTSVNMIDNNYTKQD